MYSKKVVEVLTSHCFLGWQAEILRDPVRAVRKKKWFLIFLCYCSAVARAKNQSLRKVFFVQSEDPMSASNPRFPSLPTGFICTPTTVIINTHILELLRLNTSSMHSAASSIQKYFLCSNFSFFAWRTFFSSKVKKSLKRFKCFQIIDFTLRRY